MDEMHYFEMEETAAMGRFLQDITNAVVKRNEGRNRSCWPVLSFGGKDADLEPGGCTGIRSLTWKDEDTLLLEVGGHKTFAYSDPTEIEDEEEYQAKKESLVEAEWNFLCDACFGLSCDGDAEDFTTSFTEELEVPLVFKDLDFDMEATVDVLIKAAEERCDEFENKMRQISEEYDKLTGE